MSRTPTDIKSLNSYNFFFAKMIREIVKQKTSADHLLYVSLKYTKTCDVILNLIARWASLIELGYDALLTELVEQGKIPSVPKNPRQKIELVKKHFPKVEELANVAPLYIVFRRIPTLEKKRQGEFRKNVSLKIIEGDKVTDINMDKLMEYSILIDDFIREVKKVLL